MLGLVVVLCLSLIGAAGYVKFELSQAESHLAAPGNALGGETDVTDKIRRALGYNGFTGAAQNYAETHKIDHLPDMRASLKLTNDLIGSLPEKTPADARREILAIINVFDAVMKKAEKAANDPAASFTVLDLAPIYATLPVLDARLSMASASNRMEAQSEAEMWAMLLTFITWGSLIIACAMTVGVYLTLLNRQSAPLRALTQSIKNLAQGDMRTSIWGMERQDSIGDLARAIDMARYQFSQMPDMSLMSDKGPVRLRFEGNTRSVFEAMIGAMSKDSELVRTHAATLADSISKQHDVVTLLSSRVEAVLHNVEKRGMDGDKQVKDILNKVLGSAEALKNAQEHAADQLNRVVPFLQERAQGMAEITQIAGKQIAQSLQSLTLSERGLKTSAEQSKDAINKLATTADDLGGRLFGAVNLLQASGKVLSETTETTQSRLNEAVDKLKEGMAIVHPAPASPSVDTIVPRIEEAITALEAVQNRLEERLTDTANTARIQVDLLSGSTERLNDIGAKLEQQIKDISNNNGSISDAGLLKINALAGQLDSMAAKLSVLDRIAVSVASAAAPVSEPAFVDALQSEIRNGMETTIKNISELREQLAGMAASATAAPAAAMPDDLMSQMRDHWRHMAGQIEATRGNLEIVINHQMQSIQSRLDALSSAPPPPAEIDEAHAVMEQQTQILSELVATMGILDAHMQDIRQQVAGMANRKAG